jgi:ABC-2 type transport system ATP-binding protein
MENVLEVKNLTKKFGNFTAVDNLTFSIKDGEILGLLGLNGAGKTTTIQMLLGIMKPTAGNILYFGKPFKINREQVLKQINFSSTYISLPWFFTVYEILDVFSRLYEIPNRKNRISKLLKEFEIEYLINKQFYNLSAGEKTRVLLAKSFINYPKIILLDEPTASLDVDIAIKVREFLKKEKREYKTSMLLTSHNMEEVEEMCDRVIILNNGKLLIEDTPENLIETIANTRIELIIRKESKKAVEFFMKNQLSFKQEEDNFKIVIDEKRIAEFLALLAKEKIEYEEINIKKPDLEDYFLKVTRK